MFAILRESFWGGGFIVGSRAAAGTVHVCKAPNSHASYPSRESETACYFDCPMNLPRTCHPEDFACGGQCVRRR